MPRNLQNKIYTLLDDIEDLDRHEAAKRIEALVKEEINFQKIEHVIGRHDLSVISSKAVQTFIDTDPRNFGQYSADSEKHRAWCFVDATVNFLKNKGLISCVIRYDKNKK